MLKKLLKSFSKWLGFKKSDKRSAKKIASKSSRRIITKKQNKKKLTKNKILKKKTIQPKKVISKLPGNNKAKKQEGALGELVGEITHYFPRIGVVVLKILKGPIKVGDKIHILSSKADFVQKIQSMQVESVDVKVAKKGQLIGLKVVKEAFVGDKVYKSQ